MTVHKPGGAQVVALTKTNLTDIFRGASQAWTPALGQVASVPTALSAPGANRSTVFVNDGANIGLAIAATPGGTALAFLGQPTQPGKLWVGEVIGRELDDNGMIRALDTAFELPGPVKTLDVRLRRGAERQDMGLWTPQQTLAHITERWPSMPAFLSHVPLELTPSLDAARLILGRTVGPQVLNYGMQVIALDQSGIEVLNTTLPMGIIPPESGRLLLESALAIVPVEWRADVENKGEMLTALHFHRHTGAIIEHAQAGGFLRSTDEEKPSDSVVRPDFWGSNPRVVQVGGTLRVAGSEIAFDPAVHRELAAIAQLDAELAAQPRAAHKLEEFILRHHSELGLAYARMAMGFSEKEPGLAGEFWVRGGVHLMAHGGPEQREFARRALKLGHEHQMDFNRPFNARLVQALSQHFGKFA